MKISIYKVSTEEEIIINLAILLDKLISAYDKIFVYCQNNSTMEILDNKLWTFSQNYFIPHRIINSEKINPDDLIFLSDKLDSFDKHDFKTLVIYGDKFFIDYTLKNDIRTINTENVFVLTDIKLDLSSLDCQKSFYIKEDKKWLKTEI